MTPPMTVRELHGVLVDPFDGDARPCTWTDADGTTHRGTFAWPAGLLDERGRRVPDPPGSQERRIRFDDAAPAPAPGPELDLFGGSR